VIGEPIDPEPFFTAMPEGVRDAITHARGQRSGRVFAWLVARGRGWGQVGSTMTLLRDATTPRDLAGWLAGMAMFHDDTDRLVDELESHAAAATFALAAFAAGIAANIPTAPGQWERIERLASLARPPESLAAVVPIGCASDITSVRNAAKRLAKKLGAAAQTALEAATTSAKGNTRRRLAAAHTKAADHAGDREGLLLRLLGNWAVTRSPEIEGTIDALGKELGRARPPIAGKSREAIETAWAVVAKQHDPVDVFRLLEATWPKSLDAARRRVELFAKFPPDPRITLGVTTRAARHRSWQSIKFHRAVARLVIDAPMRAAAAAIDAIIKTHDAAEIVETYEEARSVAFDLKPKQPDRALLDEAAGTREREQGRTQQLEQAWAAHVADPGDLAHRAVLADALQAAGDPRGELIALQLADNPDTETKKRIAALIAAHADAWTGPIPNVAKHARRFERGFLVALRCTAIGGELRAVYNRPEWVTLEDLYIDGAGCELAPLVRRMPLLRRLATPHPDLLTQLGRTGTYPGITAIACARPWLPVPKQFPNLRVLASRWIESSWTTAFRDAQTDAATLGIEAVVHLGLPAPYLERALVQCSAPPETRFAIGGDFAGFATDGWRVRVFRDSRIAELAWGGGSSALKEAKDTIVAALSAHRKDIREVKRIDLGA
jgi:hypothetical protein